MKKLKSGYINGTRVILGNLGDFLNTSAITDLSFLGSQEDGYPDSKLMSNFWMGKSWFSCFTCQIELNPEVQAYLDEHLLRSFSTRHVHVRASYGRSQRSLRRRMSVKGTIKKKISINVDCEYFNHCTKIVFLTIKQESHSHVSHTNTLISNIHCNHSLLLWIVSQKFCVSLSSHMFYLYKKERIWVYFLLILFCIEFVIETPKILSFFKFSLHKIGSIGLEMGL